MCMLCFHHATSCATLLAVCVSGIVFFMPCCCTQVTALADSPAKTAAMPSSSLGGHIDSAETIEEEEEDFNEDLLEGRPSQLAVQQNLLNMSLRPDIVSSRQHREHNGTCSYATMYRVHKDLGPYMHTSNHACTIDCDH